MDIDIREQIIEAARKIFSRFGFQKTTVDEIAHSIHKAKSSIYHYFRSKEEIFKEVITKEYLYFKKAIDVALEEQDSPKEKLRAYVLTRLKVLLNLANIYSALKNDYFEYLEMIEELREKYTKEEIRNFEAILQEGVDQGDFVVKNINVTASTIVAALKGLEFSWAMEEDRDKLEKDINSLLDIFFYGIIRR